MSLRAASWVVVHAPRARPRLRLVCFPHGGGGANAFRSWPGHLPDWIEVLAIAPPGRGARHGEPPLDDMTAMVAAVGEALAPHLDMPFALLGHSVGALVAFETARALEAQDLTPLRVFVSGLAAPGHGSEAPPMHAASDAALLAEITALGLVPEDVGRDAELSAMLLTPLRADFKLAETHRVPDAAVIAAPITALGGRDDALAPAADLAPWRRRTRGGFRLRMFDGGHFFTESARGEVMAVIAEQLADDLAALPPSILLGAAEDYPLDVCLHDLFRRAAAATPEAIALVGVERALTFAVLDRESDLLAGKLAAMGVGVDRMVAILLETSVDFVVAYLAALKAGGAYLPVPLATPDRAIADILDAVAPVAVVTRAALATRLPEPWRAASRAVLLDDGWQQRLARETPTPPAATAARPTPDSLAYCVMTSGTTGRPKGIVCPHRGAVNSYWWRYRHLPYGDDEREAANVFFVWEVLRPLLQGRPAYVIPDDVIFDPRRLVAFLADHRITRVLFTPSLFAELLAAGGDDLAARLDALDVVILNGEVVTAALAERARERLPHVALVNDYSISECHDVATSYRPDVADWLDAHGASPGARRYLPAGRVMGNVRVYVLDDHHVPVPWGCVGEVFVAGPTLARGYLDLPQVTAERFVPDPIQGGNHRMFRTGDLGRALPDGQLEIRGRAGFMVKLRGYTVVPSAVEAAIAAHPEVAAAAVVTADDPDSGQPEHLVAYVAGRHGAPDAAMLAAIRGHLKDRLPAYAIPAVLVPLVALPIQATTGKIDRRRLPAPPGDAKVSEARPLSTPTGDGPVVAMRALWHEVLGRAVARDDDNFFDLGGHSLLAIRLALAAEARFGVRLDVVDVFDHPTLAGFANHVARQAGPGPQGPISAAPAARGATPVEQSPAGAESSAEVAVAVVGMACRLPGASTPEALWRNLMAGRSAIRDLSDSDLDALAVPQALRRRADYVRRAAMLDDVALFDPAHFALSLREATLMDPQQRLFLLCCHEALERAGHAPGHEAGRVGVYAGCYLPGYLVHHLGARRHYDPADPVTFHIAELGNAPDYLASRVAYLLDLDGPAVGVQTSCSTGLVAIAEAAEAIRAGRCDMALAGASSVLFPQGGYLAIDGHVGSPSGECRTFDATADGTVLGDGVAVVVLRRLDRALADGDTILAVVKGAAVNNDGAAKAGYSAPGVEGQSAVVAAALERAGVEPESVGYVEAHGTATIVGDPIEVRALTAAWRRHTDRVGFAAIGSLKPNIGHANIAAGAAGFIKAVLAIAHGEIPPQIGFATANPELRLDTSPFFVATTAQPFPVPVPGAPRRAAVTSLGIGGTNAHVILEQAPERGQPDHASGEAPEILPLSARTDVALARLRDDLAHHLDEGSHGAPLGAVAATLALGRRHRPRRLAVVASSAAAAARRLRAAAPVGDRGQGGIVLVIPGQGAQHAGMAAGPMRSSAVFRHHMERAATAFAAAGGPDLAALADERSAQQLLATADGLQPALFAVAHAAAATLIEWGVRPAAVAGHSLGQVVAAVVGGVLTLDDAARLVVARARAMQAAPAGAMLALAASEDAAAALAAGLAGCALAAVNGPRDTVVAGPPEAIVEIERRASARGVAARRVAVARAFHSPLMRDAAREVAAAARELPHRPPRIAVACNVRGGWLTGEDIAEPGAYWARHVLAPVRFADNVAATLALRPALVIETGPGQTLARLLSRAAGASGPVVTSAMCRADAPPGGELEALLQAAARAYEAGADIDWVRLREGRPTRRVAVPTTPFDLVRCWPADDEALRNPEAVAPAATQRPGAAREGRLPWRDWFLVPSLRRVPVAEDEDPARRSWVMLRPADGDDEAMAALAAELVARGDDVTALDLTGDGWQAGLAAAVAVIAARGALAHVLAWASTGNARSADPSGPLSRLVDLVRAVADAARGGEIELRLVSRGALAAPGAPAVPALAALPGVLLVLAQEHPGVRVGLVDIAASGDGDDDGSGRDAPPGLADEVRATGARPEPFVAVRDGACFVARYDPLPLGASARARGRSRLAVGPHLVTGGLGRIGLVLARHLAGLGAEVVLLSRRTLPPRERWAETAADPATQASLRDTLAALLAADGGRGLIRVVAADAADRDGMVGVLGACAARHGALGGVFHAAGLARLEDIADVTPQSLAAELQPKVAGTRSLAYAIAETARRTDVRPAFVMTFSSLAATLGGLGLASYAAANRYLDAFVAAAPVRSGVPWISVAWDDWDFDYGSTQQAAYAATRAAVAIPPEDGMAAIEAILGEPALDRVLVSATPFSARLARWAARRGADPAIPPATRPAAAPSVVRSLPQCNGGGAAGLPETAIERAVHDAYVKVLGNEAIQIDDDFFALGGDSLLATEIVVALSPVLAACGARLRVTDVFDHPSVRRLAAHVSGHSKVRLQAAGGTCFEDRKDEARGDTR